MSDAPQFEADQFEALLRDTLGRHGLRAAASTHGIRPSAPIGTRTA
jgi:hypothetical protein